MNKQISSKLSAANIKLQILKHKKYQIALKHEHLDNTNFILFSCGYQD